jgi:hypothetical protein
VYIVIALIVLMASALLFRRAGGSLSLTKLNMVTFTFYTMVGSMFLGSTAIVTGILAIGHLEKLQDQRVFSVGWAAVMYAMIAVPVGMLVVRPFITRLSARQRIDRYRGRPVEPLFVTGDRYLTVVLKAATAVSAVALLYTLWALPDVPLFNVLRGESDTGVLQLQRAAARLGQGQGPLMSFITSLIELHVSYLHVLTVAAFFYWRQSRLPADRRWFAIALLLTLLSVTYNIAKAPLMIFIVNFMVVITATTRRVRLFTVLGTVGIGTVLMVTMYVYYRDALAGGERGVLGVWADVVLSRIAAGNLISFYYCLDLFPSAFPHIGFSSTGRLVHQLLQLPYSQDYGLIVMNYIDSEGVASGAAGHATAVFLGEAWANFGWVGLFAGPLVVGGFIQTVHLWFLKSRKSPLHLGLYGSTLGSFTLTSGLTAFYYPAGLVQLGVFSWALVGLAILLRAGLTRRRSPVPARAPTGVLAPATPGGTDATC